MGDVRSLSLSDSSLPLLPFTLFPYHSSSQKTEYSGNFKPRALPNLSCSCLFDTRNSHPEFLTIPTLVLICRDQYFGTDVCVSSTKEASTSRSRAFRSQLWVVTTPMSPCKRGPFDSFVPEPEYQFNGLWSVLQIRTQDAQRLVVRSRHR
jgi:hypothetical protein